MKRSLASASLSAVYTPLPDVPSARDTWLSLALHIERRLDAGLDIERRGSLSIAERLDRLGKTEPLDNPQAIIAAAEHHSIAADLDSLAGPERWLDALERAIEANRTLERQRSRELDHDLGISL